MWGIRHVYRPVIKALKLSARNVTLQRPFSSPSLASLLSSRQKSIIKDEKSIFDELHGYLQQIDANQSDIDLVVETKSRVDDVFLVVIVGEFNAGKSSFINALLGEKYLKVGVLPTTSKIGILRSQPDSGVASGIWKKAEKIMLDDVEELDLPVGWLNHVALIDTPGTNAIIEKHEALTLNIVPRSDLVLFVTSAERPITESERDFLNKIQKWGKKVIVIVNKIDLLRNPEDRQQVLTFVSQNVGNILGSTMPVQVFGISSTDGLQSKQVAAREGVSPTVSVSARQWEESGLGVLENYLKAELGRNELIRNKLQNPLMLADRILADALGTVRSRLISLESDSRVLSTIESINVQFNNELDRDLEIYRGRGKSIIEQIIQSTDTFLDQNVSLLKPELLLHPNRLQEAFTSAVVIDAKRHMTNLAIEISELLTNRAKTQARNAVDYLGTRPRRYHGGSVSNIIHDARFDNIRKTMNTSLQEDIDIALNKYDQQDEIATVGSGLRSAFIAASGASLLSAIGATYIGIVGDLSIVTDALGAGALGGTSVASTGLVAWKKSHARSVSQSVVRIISLSCVYLIRNNKTLILLHQHSDYIAL